MFNCAFDLGASGGRVMVSEWDGRTLKLTEMHRFPNEPVLINGMLYWDVPRLFHEMKIGLKKIAVEKIPLSGMGIDTWGVDYALLDGQGHVIGAPVHYRDSRTDGYPALLPVPLAEVYTLTGIQLLPFNTLFQLMADADGRTGILNAASDLLFMPDLFTYFLTGQKINEYTIASTSQLINADSRDWDGSLIDRVFPAGIRRLFKPVTMPGTVIGPLTEDTLAETGLDAGVKFIAVGSHDTASAVAGTPLTDDGCAYLSCGTWSLLGMELDKPRLTAQSFERDFTNEGGLDGKIRYLKNINGLWIIQQLLKSYNDHPTDGRKLGFADLIREAENAPRKHFRVSPNDPSFNNPPDMAAAVRSYCNGAGQGTPQGIGETAIAVYNGLAGEYAAILRDLETHLDKPVHTLHMVGGGVKDTLLCRLTAQATGKRVVAGPVEASVLGNIAAQWIGLGTIKYLSEARDIIRQSFEPEIYVG